MDSALAGAAFRGEPHAGIPRSAKSPPSLRRFEAVVFGDQEDGTFCLVLRREGSAEGGSDEGSPELGEGCRFVESMIDSVASFSAQVWECSCRGVRRWCDSCQFRRRLSEDVAGSERIATSLLQSD